MMKYLLLAALPAALAAQQPAADSLHPITLKQALALAQQNAPAAIAAEGQIATANANVTAAYAAFIPSLSWSMGQSQSSGPRLGQDGTIIQYQNPWSYSTGIRTSIQLFDGGHDIANLRTAKWGVKSAEANEVAQKFSIALNVKTQYYNVLAAEESEAAAQATLDQAVEQLKVSVAKLTAGAVTRSDSLRSAIQVGNARLGLLTAQTNKMVASAALTRLVATPYLVTANPADTLEDTIAPVDSALIATLAQTGPSIRSAEAALASSKAAQTATRASYFPTISVSYGRNGSGYDKYFGIGGGSLSYSKNLSLSLSYNIFDNWARESASTGAAVNVVNAEATLRDTQLAAQQSVVQLVVSLQTLQEEIGIQQQSIAAAAEDLRVQEQRYAVGASALLDVLTSQTALSQARFQLIQYRLNFRTTKAQVEQLIGRDLN